jgi:hypothetical protein
MKYSLPITLLSPWYPSAVATTQRLELCSDESTKVNLCYSAAERSYSALRSLAWNEPLHIGDTAFGMREVTALFVTLIAWETIHPAPL